MRPCKHLDFDSDYTDCEIVEIPGFSCRVRHWKRGNRWTEPAFEGADPGPKNVQFCGQGRGRINGIFQCYNKGEMPCYDPESEGDQP